MNTTFRRFLLICLFEAALGVVAWLVGLLVGYSPLATLYWSWESLLWGALGTVPLIGGLLWLERSEAAPFVKIRRVIEEILVPMFYGFALWQLAIVALLAGAGEEILLRGLIQGGLVSLLNFGSGATIWWSQSSFMLFTIALPSYIFLRDELLHRPLRTNRPSQR